MKKMNWLKQWSLTIATIFAIIIFFYGLVTDRAQLMTFGLGLLLGAILGSLNALWLLDWFKGTFLEFTQKRSFLSKG